MSINTHINNWITKAEPDYYTMFIKAWIPYNAWYMHNFYDEDASPKRTNDKEILNHIKTNNNKYKDRIIGLLRGTDEDALVFKSLISKLHYELEAHPAPNYDERIAFTSICIEDNTPSDKTIIGAINSCKGKKDTTLNKTQPRWVFEVVNNRSQSTISRIALYKCSITELKANVDYKALISDDDKRDIEVCLNEINPKKAIDIISPPIRKKSGKFCAPTNCITIDENKHLYFRDNYEDVSKAIIQIIYELRCKLFHGEIDPTDSCSGIFEYAFHIQKMLIKELK